MLYIYIALKKLGVPDETVQLILTHFVRNGV